MEAAISWDGEFLWGTKLTNLEIKISILDKFILNKLMNIVWYYKRPRNWCGLEKVDRNERKKDIDMAWISKVKGRR